MAKGTKCTGWGYLQRRNGGRRSVHKKWSLWKFWIYAGSKFPDGGHKGNSNGRPSEVAQLQPTDIGLYDMSGNVAEWIWDYHTDYPKPKQIIRSSVWRI